MTNPSSVLTMSRSPLLAGTESYGPPTAVGSLYASLSGAWIVYALWPLAAIVLALIVVRHRDV